MRLRLFVRGWVIHYGSPHRDGITQMAVCVHVRACACQRKGRFVTEVEMMQEVMSPRDKSSVFPGVNGCV